MASDDRFEAFPVYLQTDLLLLGHNQQCTMEIILDCLDYYITLRRLRMFARGGSVTSSTEEITEPTKIKNWLQCTCDVGGFLES